MLRKLLAIILLCASGIAAADTAQRWIVGSYVNVRAQAAKDAEIVDHLIANTPVTLLKANADFCEISWGKNQQGFVACKLLGEQALSLDEIGAETLPGSSTAEPDPKYSPLRAFWLEPTIKRLFEAGEYFRTAMLPAAPLLAENCFGNSYYSNCPSSGEAVPKAPELKRFQIPEFEAMKKLMIDGLVAPRSQFQTPMTWQDLGPAIKKYTAQYGGWYQGVSSEVYEKIKLPAVKPSFFKSVDEIGRARAGAEELSAQYRIPHRMNVLGKPKYEFFGGGYSLTGAWDIGRVRDSLTQPVCEVAISIKGDVSVGETDAQTDSTRNYYPDGDIQFAQDTAKNPLPGYKKINHPLIFFRLAQPPVLTKVKASVKKSEAVFHIDTLEGKVTTARIDLDNDGVDDLLVSDVDNVGGPCDSVTRVSLANVAGRWYFLSADLETCSD